MLKGYITLISVLILSAVGTVIVVAILVLGSGSVRSGLALEQSVQAKALANACAEEALQQISDSIPFTGSGGLSLGQGTCSYTVASQGGQNRTVEASGTVDSVVRKVAITIDQIAPSISIVSWQEVDDF